MLERIGRIVQNYGLLVDRPAEALLRSGTSGQLPCSIPLIAICGAPRTGTTLTYQLICQAFDLVFISNLQNVLYRTPVLGYKLAFEMLRPYVSDYKSQGGFVQGLNAPAESMRFWKYWCDHDLTEKEPSVGKDRIYAFAHSMNAIYKYSGVPLLGGYMAHAFYTDHLQSIFKNCVFVRTDRELLDASLSALNRWRRTEPEDAAAKAGFFFGTRPREIQKELTPHAYVAAQQYYIAKRLDRVEQKNPQRVFHARYSQICDNPLHFIDNLLQFLQQAGIRVSPRNDTEIPESFQARIYSGDDKDAEKIDTELRRLHS